MLIEHYLLLKLVHLAAVIVWCASAVGAWWFVLVSWWQRRQSPDDPELIRRDEWVRLQFTRVVILEHVAFLVLVPTGVLLWWALGLSIRTTPWLRWKVAIVFGILVPMEAYDIWLSHWHVPRALRRKSENPGGFTRALRRHDVFLWGGSVVVAITIPTVLYLVVMRPY